MKKGITNFKGLLATPYFYIAVGVVVALIVVGTVFVVKNKDKGNDEPIGGLELIEDGDELDDDDSVIDFSEFEDDDDDKKGGSSSDDKKDNNKDNNKEDNKEDDKNTSQGDGEFGRFF